MSLPEDATAATGDRSAVISTHISRLIIGWNDDVVNNRCPEYVRGAGSKPWIARKLSHVGNRTEIGATSPGFVAQFQRQLLYGIAGRILPPFAIQLNARDPFYYSDRLLEALSKALANFYFYVTVSE